MWGGRPRPRTGPQAGAWPTWGALWARPAAPASRATFSSSRVPARRHDSVLSLSCRVKDKMRLSADKRSLVVNPSLTLPGIPPDCCSYRPGNRSTLEWFIDQYQVTEDPRSGIRLDPNRPDDPGYISRLLAQVIRLSLDTLSTLRSLPAWH